jgi:hypothetical protein
MNDRQSVPIQSLPHELSDREKTNRVIGEAVTEVHAHGEPGMPKTVTMMADHSDCDDANDNFDLGDIFDNPGDDNPPTDPGDADGDGDGGCGCDDFFGGGDDLGGGDDIAD